MADTTLDIEREIREGLGYWRCDACEDEFPPDDPAEHARSTDGAGNYTLCPSCKDTPVRIKRADLLRLRDIALSHQLRHQIDAACCTPYSQAYWSERYRERRYSGQVELLDRLLKEW